MNKTFLIADTHFDDEMINIFENRPFKSTLEARNCIVKNWNSVVNNEDTVYLLGDVFAENSDESYIEDTLKSLNGKIVIIAGNHDNPELFKDIIKKSNLENRITIINYPIIIEGFYILSHEPLYINKTMPYCNIFGHVHSNPIYPTVGIRHYCVSVERISYTPIEFTTAKKAILNENRKANNSILNKNK